ncbi:efflux RND transporter periplasmic adaptor subunit [Selenomonas sp.]|uniref:efflux RND transporter periplasmic adaptor subunit n=1 Tax=Selenomonas sp. TaxID=2053611 RepID=UPI0025DE2B15|nr:efflux RND transporter periplasmic adaptor subunit [Selenomonas sp.]
MKNFKFLTGALLMVSILVSGCSHKAETQDKPVLVKTQQAGWESNAVRGSYSGTVKGRHETNMSFQVGGQILARNVQEGSRVRAGDVLMVIDARDVLQQANQGDAQVASARAQLDLAEKNLERYTQLYQENAVSRATLDQYQTNYDAAFAAYRGALAQQKQGHNSLGYTNLIAGANGVVSAVSAEEGQVVAAGQTVLTLVQTGELEVEISVPESKVSELTIGMPVSINFWALKGRADGAIREISPMADEATRTYKVRVAVSEPPAGMQLGMTANVSIKGIDDQEENGGVLLPLAAIFQEGDTPQVWVVGEDNTLTAKAVRVENLGDDKVQVKGLNAGDLIVVAGVHKLHEGQSVRTEAD